jgi:hypothetical protein
MTPFIMFDAWAAKGRSWRRMSREREMNHDSPENIGSFPVLQWGRSVDTRWTAGWTLSKSCTNLISSANGVEETFDDLGDTCIARREMRLVAWRGTMSRERSSSAVGRLGAVRTNSREDEGMPSGCPNTEQDYKLIYCSIEAGLVDHPADNAI